MLSGAPVSTQGLSGIPPLSAKETRRKLVIHGIKNVAAISVTMKHQQKHQPPAHSMLKNSKTSRINIF